MWLLSNLHSVDFTLTSWYLQSTERIVSSIWACHWPIIQRASPFAVVHYIAYKHHVYNVIFWHIVVLSVSLRSVVAVNSATFRPCDLSQSQPVAVRWLTYAFVVCSRFSRHADRSWNETTKNPSLSGRLARSRRAQCPRTAPSGDDTPHERRKFFSTSLKTDMIIVMIFFVCFPLPHTCQPTWIQYSTMWSIIADNILKNV